MEPVLYRYNPWWSSAFRMSSAIERKAMVKNLLDQLPIKQISFLTGLRRIGKTTLMKMVIDSLINESGVDPRKILYVSLDDYLLEKNTILEITEEFRKIHRLKFSEFIYLFLDEITYKKDFEVQLKNLHDVHHVKIFATSSSSSLLKRKKALLTGRSRVFELHPLTFNEFLTFRRISIKPEDNHLVEGHFDDFLRCGGIPEAVLHDDSRYLQDLADDIIYKDIAAENGIRDLSLLRDFFLLLMERSGKVISINKIASILKISPDTSKRYLDLFEETYLIYLVNRAGKTNERILSPKKIYAADTGMRSRFSGFKDKGSLFENYVYLRLRNFRPEYIYKDGTELDFLINKKSLVEVKYHPEPLGEKQQALFDSYPVKDKSVLRTNEDIEKWLSKV